MSLTRSTKVVILGSISVGKTALMTRIVEDSFDSNPKPTTCVAYTQFRPPKENGVIIQFWDTVGMERYKSINKIYYHDAEIALLTFDLTERKTFDDITLWKAEFEKQNTVQHSVTLLVGNKCDLISEIQISEENVRSWAMKLEIEYFQVSARTGEGVTELLDGIVKVIRQNSTRPLQMIETGIVRNLEVDERKCC
jgi:small GTP-binding protein